MSKSNSIFNHLLGGKYLLTFKVLILCVLSTFFWLLDDNHIEVHANKSVSISENDLAVKEETKNQEIETQEKNLLQNFWLLWDTVEEKHEDNMDLITEDPAIDGTYEPGYHPEDYVIRPDFLWSSLAASNSDYSILPNEGAYCEYYYTNFVETFTAPTNGIYKIETWGGQGGGESSTDGGFGGYAYGYYKMNRNQKIYVCVGAAGLDANGGYNGGAAGQHGAWDGGWRSTGAGGGGCTSVTTANRGTLVAFDAYRQEVLLVAGGGGGNHHVEGASYYDHKKEDSRGSGAGGLTTEGFIAYVIKSKDGTNPYEVQAPVKSVGQTYGYQFGLGGGAGNAAGAGGGGWYGGYAVNLGNGVRSGGGGTSYIGGLPKIVNGSHIYEAGTNSSVNRGNGKAKISLVKKSLEATILQKEINKIELQDIKIMAQFEGSESHTWEMQRADSKNSLLDNNWKQIDSQTNNKYSESLENDNGNLKAGISFRVEKDDNNTWYRLKVTGDSVTKYTEPCQLQVIPLKIDHLLLESENRIEVGERLKTNQLHIIAVYNNPAVVKNIWEIPDLQNNLYFVEKEKLMKEFVCSKTGVNQQVIVRLNHLDQPKDLLCSYQVVDTKSPEIHDVSIINHKFISQNMPETFQIQIDASDESNGTLYYYISHENGEILSEKQTKSEISASFQHNEVIIIYVCDESGNYTQKQIPVVYVDEQGPSVDVSADITEWTQKPVTIAIDSADELSGLAEKPYSFDAGKTWQTENTYQVTKNDKIVIQVRDKVGHITQKEFGVKNIDQTPPELRNIISSPEDNWCEGEAVVTVSANDSEAGLAEKPYSFDGGNTWQKEPYIALKNSAVLQIYIQDQLGNICKNEYEIVKISKIQDVLNDVLKQDTTVIQKNSVSDNNVQTNGQAHTSRNHTLQEKQESIEKIPDGNTILKKREIKSEHSDIKKPVFTVIEKTVEDFVENVISQNIGEQDKNNKMQSVLKQGGDGEEKELSNTTTSYKIPISRALGAVTGGTAGVVWFGFFVFYFRKCYFYSINEFTQEEEYFKSKIIRRSVRNHAICYVKFYCLSSDFEKKSFSIHFSKRFLKKYLNKILIVSFKDCEYDVRIGKKTIIQIK